MKIGKVYANAEREEDRANRILIEMGAITGEGLLGEVLKAVDKLFEAAKDYGYYGESSPEGIQAINEIESVWVELFAALKAIEEAA